MNVLGKQLVYWMNQLAGAPTVLEIPSDRPRSPVGDLHRAICQFTLPSALVMALRQLTPPEETSLFVTLMSGFIVLLNRYTGQEDMLVGTPVALRTQGEAKFVENILALRAKVSSDTTFARLVREVRQTTLDAQANQDLPFSRLVEELRIEPAIGHNSLVQVVFQLRHESPFPGECTAQNQPARCESIMSKIDLALSLVEQEEELRGAFEYNADLFDEATIERMFGHFETLLQGIVVNPERRLSELSMLTEGERHRILIEWNDTQRDYPKDKCIHQLFEAQVERTPDSIAVVFEDQQLTYRELNARTNQVAHYLKKRGVGAEVLVGICIERSLEMVVTLLGVLKAGGAYVPLDPTYPRERLAFMLEDSQVRVLLTQAQLRGGLAQHAEQIVCLDDDRDAIARESEDNPVFCGKPEALAYVIYTSGSTGKPKGVAIEHHSTVTFLHWARTTFTPEDLAGVLAATSICFDLSVFELFVPLSWGGKVILAENVLQLSNSVVACDVTLINTVPSAIAELLRVGGLPDSVKIVNLAGEPLQISLVKQIYEQGKIERVFDLYGPSEDTTYSTCAIRDGNGPATVGRPIANTQIYLLDSCLQPVPIGVPGALHIGGDGLARCYLNRPELTAEKFIPNPFSDEAGARLYKTGDLARYLPDGNIQFLGRLDSQVKIRGYRIELGEIEAVLSQHPGVREAMVLARPDISGDKRLVAYVVSNGTQTPATNDLREFLRARLPEYMVPSAFLRLDRLLLTSSGKVDRRRLPAPDQQHVPETIGEFARPRDSLERELAEIWEKVLTVKRVGIRDHIFDLGGNSLQMVRLIAQIEKNLHVNLPLSALFQAPTIEQFALLVRRKREPSSLESPLPASQSSGHRPPLFSYGGSVELARYLGSDQPCYLLQFPGLNGHPAPATIEEMAKNGIEEIRGIQPHGPYFLAGYSFGGLVMFEIAQQLQQQAEPIALLVLIDPMLPKNEVSGAKPANSHSAIPHSALLNRLFHPCGNLASLGLREKLGYILVEVRRRIDRLKIDTQRLACTACFRLGYRLPRPLRWFYFLQLAVETTERYVPKAFSGPLIVFRRPNYGTGEEWRRLAAGRIEIHEVLVGHGDFIKEPYVQVFASNLKNLLQRAHQVFLPIWLTLGIPPEF
jgi:amino acid adenylation domain-containing protein